MSARIAPRFVKRFARDDSAAAAVEFALIVPLLITLIFGGIDITESVTARRKAVQASSTMSDLVAQDDEISQAQMNNVFMAGAAIMTPFDSSRLETIVSSVRIDANKVARVAWSQAQHTSARVAGATFTLPEKLLIPDTSVVVAEVRYRYTPVIGNGFIGEINIPKVTYALPRTGSKQTGVKCTWSGCT
jgi:Flp pilus assembly protein TadG